MKKDDAPGASLPRKIAAVDRLVGERIRACRRAAGLSQGELAARLGLSYQQIQKYESAANRVSAGRLWALARELGVEVGAFFAPDRERGARRRPPSPLARLGGGLDPEVEAALSRLVRALARVPD